MGVTYKELHLKNIIIYISGLMNYRRYMSIQVDTCNRVLSTGVVILFKRFGRREGQARVQGGGCCDSFLLTYINSQHIDCY